MNEETTRTDVANDQTAPEAYARRLRRVSAMLGWIEDELETHQQKQTANPGNWGFVGDLTAMDELIKRALGHISGIDEAHIDQALTETEA